MHQIGCTACRRSPFAISQSPRLEPLGSGLALKANLAAELETARRSTLELLAPVPDEDLTQQVSPIMSPLVWDLAHIGWYEELWLLRRVADRLPRDHEHDSIYDAFQKPREARGPGLPLLSAAETRSYIASVRREVLEVLEAN